MTRHPSGRREWITRLGRVEVRRGCHRCGSCGGGRFPLDRALGLEADTFTPGVADTVAGTVSLMGFDAAATHIADLAGPGVPAGSLQRRSPGPGAEAMESGRDGAVGGDPLESRMYLAVDGTGIPMRGEGTEGVTGKGEDGSARTRGGGWPSCTPPRAGTGRPARRRGQGQRTGRLPDRQRGGAVRGPGALRVRRPPPAGRRAAAAFRRPGSRSSSPTGRTGHPARAGSPSAAAGSPSSWTGSTRWNTPPPPAGRSTPRDRKGTGGPRRSGRTPGLAGRGG